MQAYSSTGQEQNPDHFLSLKPASGFLQTHIWPFYFLHPREYSTRLALYVSQWANARRCHSSMLFWNPTPRISFTMTPWLHFPVDAAHGNHAATLQRADRIRVQHSGIKISHMCLCVCVCGVWDIHGKRQWYSSEQSLRGTEMKMELRDVVESRTIGTL